MSSNEGTLSAGHVNLGRSRESRGRSWVSSLTWPRPELLALLVLAGVLNLWALDQERLGQRVLLGRRALDELELAQLPLRLVRRQRRDDGGQAAARAVGAGALGEALRLPLAEHSGAAGADGRRERGARLRPCAPSLRAPRRVRGWTRAGAHADRRGDLASQQPGRAADAVLRRGGLVHRARARDGADQVARVGRRDGRPWLRDEDGRRADGRARHRGGMGVGPAAWRAVPASGARERGRGDRGRRRLAAARGADTGVRSSMDLGHRRQLDLEPDLGLQRARPHRRPGWRPGRGRRWTGRRRRRDVLRRVAGAVPAVELGARRAGRMAARLRAGRRHRHRGRQPPAP